MASNHLPTGAGPAWRTLALAGNVMAFGTIFAHALQTAMRTVRAVWTGMLARETNVAGPTNVFARDVIACFVAKNNSWTFLFATQTVEAFRTRLCAVCPGPAFVAHANTTLCIAR